MGKEGREWESTSVSNQSLKITVILYGSLIQAHGARCYSETKSDGQSHNIKNSKLGVWLHAELDRKHF